MADRRTRTRRPDRGVVVVLTALAMVALLALAALVVDIGYAKQLRREAQSAADAAALAAGETMATGGTIEDAAAAAKRIAELNLQPLGSSPDLWTTCVDEARPDGYAVVSPATTGQCVSFDAVNRAVRVVLPEVKSPGFFGSAIGQDDYDVGALAEAAYGTQRTGFGDCGICGINGAEFQQANGNVKIDDGRQIQADVLRINGNGNANEPKSASYFLGNHSNNHKYTYSKLAGPVANPFESVTVDYTGVTMHPEMNARCEHLEPNKMYRQTVNLNSSCTLPQSGIYYFKNGINVSGTLKSRDGDKITLVFGCATGTEMTDRPRKCDGSHTGNVNISGGLQLGDPYYGGVSLLWDETAVGESVVNYNGNIKLGGAYYSRGATPAFGNGTFRATGIVFGGPGLRANMNNGNIRITAPSGDGGGGGNGSDEVWLSR